MGHSHLLIPKDYYKKHFTKYTSFHDRYKKAFNSKKTLLLYHTAEQVDLKVTREGLNYKLPEDEYLRHRYLTRNLIGYLDGSNKLELVQVHDLNTQYNTFWSKRTLKNLNTKTMSGLALVTTCMPIIKPVFLLKKREFYITLTSA